MNGGYRMSVNKHGGCATASQISRLRVNFAAAAAAKIQFQATRRNCRTRQTTRQGDTDTLTLLLLVVVVMVTALLQRCVLTPVTMGHAPAVSAKCSTVVV